MQIPPSRELQPASQGVHSPGKDLVSPRPAGQRSQRPPDLAVEPGRQRVHSPPSTDENPAAQAGQLVLAALEVCPGGHGMHSTAPTSVVCVPILQGIHFSPLTEWVPWAHGMQAD